MDAGSRNERRLMRQRGAGTRNINNNIEFALSFPTPTNARRSKTPSTGRRASRRATKTPGRRSVSQEPRAVTSAVPEASSLSRLNKRKSSLLDAVTEGPAPATGKKRRLNAMPETPSAQNDLASNSLSGVRLSIPRRPASRPSEFIAIAEEVSNNEDLASVNGVEGEVVESLEESFVDPQEDKENDEPRSGPAQVKRRKRKSISQRKQKKRSSTGSIQEEGAGESRELVDEHPTTVSESAAGPSNEMKSVAKPTNLFPTVRRQNGIAIPTEAPRSKGQSISVDETGPSNNARTKAVRQASAASERGDPEEGDSIISLQNNGPAKKRRKRKSIVMKRGSKRRVSAQSTTPAAPFPRPGRSQAHAASPTAALYYEPAENEDESYIPEELSPEPLTPAIPKKPRKTTQVVRSIESHNPTHPRDRSSPSEPRSSFPITIHRLTNASALPTISEETDLNADSDLNLPALHPAHAAPNAVDVLAQICRETIATALSTPSSARTSKRRSDALASFGLELETRLFDMSAAVEDRLSLEARLRASRRQKGLVQSRWAEVRLERERVALKMDEVRRGHWSGEMEGVERWGISEGAFGVGVVLGREGGWSLGQR